MANAVKFNSDTKENSGHDEVEVLHSPISEARSRNSRNRSARFAQVQSGRKTADLEMGMLVQRPSSARSQDVGHLLVRMFRGLYAKEPLDQQTIQNLIQSKGSSDNYHEQYVASLEKVTNLELFILAAIFALYEHI